MSKHFNPHPGRLARRALLAPVTRVARAILLVVATLPFAMPAAQAAPARIEQFNAHSWSQFQSTLPRPAVVIFTTTDCIYCPSAIAAMADEIAQRKAPIPLIVVVMDGADKPALLHDAEYKKATRLFTFAGPVAALQYSINPKWRGVTPYMAFFTQPGAPKMVAGRPQQKDLETWLGPVATGAKIQ
jgi:thiol-disulfide isomerase/thioredoxin